MARISAPDRRAQLVAAAVEVMTEEGVERASTRRIAARAGVSQGIVHYAFEDKDALLAAVIEEVALRIRGALAGASGTSGAPGSVADLLRAFWAHVEQTPDLQLLQYELTTHAVRDPAKRWLARRQYDEYLAIIEASIGGRADGTAALGTDSAASESIRRSARILLAAVDGLILQWIVFRDHDAAAAAIDDLAALVDSLTG